MNNTNSTTLNSTDYSNIAKIISITVLLICNIISFMCGFCSKVLHSSCFKKTKDKISKKIEESFDDDDHGDKVNIV